MCLRPVAENGTMEAMEARLETGWNIIDLPSCLILWWRRRSADQFVMLVLARRTNRLLVL